MQTVEKIFDRVAFGDDVEIESAADLTFEINLTAHRIRRHAMNERSLRLPMHLDQRGVSQDRSGWRRSGLRLLARLRQRLRGCRTCGGRSWQIDHLWSARSRRERRLMQPLRWQW